MSQRPYMLIRDSDLSRIRQNLAARLESWADDWFGSRASVAIEEAKVCTVGGERPSQMVGNIREFRCARVNDETLLALGVSSTRQFADLMLGANGGEVSTIVTEIEWSLARSALDALLSGLLGSVEVIRMERGDVERSFVAALQPGSDGIVLMVGLGKARIQLMLYPDGVSHLWSPTDPHADADPAALGSCSNVHDVVIGLEGARMRLAARIGETEMTIGDFASLEAGDVIVLDLPASEPIEAALGDAPHALRAFLGRESGALALQIAGVASRGPFQQHGGLD